MEIKGNAVTEGLAMGTLRFLDLDYESSLSKYKPGTPGEEQKRCEQAVDEAKADIASLLEKGDSLDKTQMEIMQAHQMLIEDMMFQDGIANYLKKGDPATEAVLKAVEDIRAVFEGIEDEYLRERQKDIIDVGNRILRKLLHMKEISVEGENLVLYAKDIEPSVMAGLSREHVKAVLLESGSKTSHTVIIAKAKGFVTLVGVTLDAHTVSQEETVIVDANKGKVILNPTQEECLDYKNRIETQEKERKYYMGRAKFPSKSKDGREFLVAANISKPKDMEQAEMYGCSGVGLYRTEFFFMDAKELPGEEEQYEAYKSVAEQSQGHMCIIRTLDIGGDKHCDCLNLKKEENPFLGYRAIRICMDRQEMYKTQLRAILRAGNFGRVGIMIPMVTTLEEIITTKKLIEEIKQDLDEKGIAYGKDVKIGIMIETPASVWLAPVFAKYVDFFSIGTNDLVQYTMAADRGNQSVSYLYDYFQPPVIHSIYHVITAAHAAGIFVGMCGEMASDKIALPFLMGLGIDELSMSPSQAPRVKEMIRSIKCSLCDMDTILKLEDAASVRQYLGSLLGQ